MKTLFTLTAALALVASAFARIGETETQIAKRFGAPITSLKESGCVSRAYVFQGFHVLVSFENGISSGESYSHSNGMPLLEPEIRTLLQANSGSGTWRTVSAEGFTTIYKSSDRQRVASYEALERKLLITTQGFIDRVSQRHHSEMTKGF